MDNEYVLTADGELVHAGIKGMRWGIRRYQNKDGSLTPAGRKRYNAEAEKLKEREKVIKNQERTKARLAKLDSKKAELDAREAALKGSDKAKAKSNSDVDDTPETKPVAKQKQASDMNDKELQDKVNRLRNEEAYKDLSKKLGYDIPSTEMDAKIADLERQKRYLELQRDIKALTPEKVSRGKKLVNTIVNDVITPAATKAGKEVLENFLKKSGMDAVGKVIGEKAKKEAAKIAKENEKAAQKEADKAKKAEAKTKKAAEKAEQAKREEEMKKYRDFQEAYAKSLEPDSSSNSSSSTYRNKGGERGYVNPNESRGLAIYNATIATVANRSVTGLPAPTTSRGKSSVDSHMNDTVFDLIGKDGETIRSFGWDDD